MGAAITTTTTKMVEKIVVKPKISGIRPVQNNEECSACDQKFSLKKVVTAYCNSKIALRGRVQLFERSQLDLITRRRNLTGKVMSNHLVVPRRDRRFFKGGRIVFGTVGPFLTAHNLRNYFQKKNEVEWNRRGSIDMFVLSDWHLNLIRKRRVRNGGGVDGDECECRSLKMARPGRRFFITADLVRFKKSMVKNVSHQNKYTNNIFMGGYNRNKRSRSDFLRRNFRMLRVTGVFEWRRVRAFVEYLENDEVDLEAMCGDVERSVEEINRRDAMYF